MNKDKSTLLIAKYAFSLMIAVGIGTFAMNILENIELNIWIARVCGGVVATISYLIFYQYWLKQ